MFIPGQMSKQKFLQMQDTDEHLSKIKRKIQLHPRFVIQDNILFKKSQDGLKVALPSALIDSLIHNKHFSLMGLHFSRTRIRRDILKKYYVYSKHFLKRIREICQSCIQCQFNQGKPDEHALKSSDLVFAPRATWSVDIIPSMSVTKAGNTAIFLAVDMFTGYLQLKAIKSRKTDELIEAIKSTIITPFGVPKYIRSDNETGMQNSTEFKAFMESQGIEFIPCSTASPWSNGAAERAVQTIKKAIRTFVQMEQEVDNWDHYIHIYTQSHNKSTNNNSFTPEELQFGYSNPSNIDFIEIWPKFNDLDDYMTKIVDIATEKRLKARQMAKNRMDKTLTYRNQSRKNKTFQKGQIVLHQQMQVSTGTGGSIKPLLTGPYVIEEIDKDGSSAVIEHLHTKRKINAHFTHLQLFNFDPKTARLPSNFDERLDLIIEKDSGDKYYPEAREIKRLKNEKNKEALALLNKRYFSKDTNTTETETEKEKDDQTETETALSDTDTATVEDSESDNDNDMDTGSIETDDQTDKVESERSKTETKTDEPQRKKQKQTKKRQKKKQLKKKGPNKEPDTDTSVEVEKQKQKRNYTEKRRKKKELSKQTNTETEKQSKHTMTTRAKAREQKFEQ